MQFKPVLLSLAVTLTACASHNPFLISDTNKEAASLTLSCYFGATVVCNPERDPLMQTRAENACREWGYGGAVRVEGQREERTKHYDGYVHIDYLCQ